METVIYFGDAVKSLDDAGKVGGYLVRFRQGAEKDLTGEYFTAASYLGAAAGDGVDVLFHHGIPVSKNLQAFASHIFSAPVKTKRDDVGVWAETVLDQADAYEAAVLQLVKAGKLGWSSGSTARVVRKSADGEILRWPIIEASLTHKPAEPLNRAIEIKAVEFFGELFDAPPVKAASGADLFAENVREQQTTFWRLEAALCESAKDIVNAAQSAPITGATVDVAGLVQQVVSAYAVSVTAMLTQQIDDYLAADGADSFYLKSSLLDALISTGLREGLRFDDRLDLVLAANEKIAADAKTISEMRATKAGAKISKDRRERLKEIMSQLQALMMEVEPPATGKSVDDSTFNAIAAQMEFQKLMQLGIE